jgi:hypothetical protein
MPTHQLGTSAAPGYVDKRRLYKEEFESRVVTGPVMFTCNATGTTTTMVGVLAVPTTNVNSVRIGDEFKLFTAAGVLKQETVFRITNVVDAASRTVTFTPAATVAPVSTDTARLVQSEDISSTGNKDRRLVALGFTAARVQTMTENDKDYQLRTSDDPGSI